MGLGTGALPSFLSHALPELSLSVVEIDPLVVSAAQRVLGGNFEIVGSTAASAVATAEEEEEREEASATKIGRAPYRVVVADAAEHVRELADQQRRVDKDLGRRREAPGDGSGVSASEADERFARLRAERALDCILLDAFDCEARVPAHLLGHEFLGDCAAVLSVGGSHRINTRSPSQCLAA